MKPRAIVDSAPVAVDFVTEVPESERASPVAADVAPPSPGASAHPFDRPRQPVAGVSTRLPVQLDAGLLKPWQAYLFAILTTGSTLGLRLAFDGLLNGQPALVIFTVPIMLSAYVGGLHAGLLATGLSYFAASYYLLPPLHSFTVTSSVKLWQQFFIVLAGGVISALNEALHRARRRAGVAIREHQAAEEDRQRFFELSQDVLCILGFDGYFTDLNPAWQKTLGYTKAELLATPFIEFIHPDDREATLAAAELVPGGKALTAFENRYRCQDGSYRYFQWNVTPVVLDQVMYGVARDVTERKRTEQALRTSEERFRFLNDLGEATRTLVDSAQIMTVMAQILGAHLRASRCAYADVEPDGEHFTILHDYTDGCASTVGHYQLSLFGARAVSTLQGGQTLIVRDVEAELFPGEGADMFKAIGIEAIVTCPLVKNGSLRAMMAVHQTTARDWQPGEIAIVQDVVERCWATIERRTAEEKVHQLNSELEQRVIERTAQLEIANKELEAFSYSVSHDLRAPLRGIDGYVRMLKEDCADQLDAEGNRLLDVVSREVRRMGQLIDDLLAFSHLGREPMANTTVDMTALARAVFESPTRADPESVPRFELKSLPLAQGDLGMLRQVFVNLIGNAVKFTRHQSAPVVEVGGSSGDGEATYYVRDNGVGFDEKYGHKLFGVFQRLHSEAEFEGTGVGLALVQRVINRHGGKVWAEGKPNQGATFYFTLPIRKGTANERSH